MAKFTPRVGQYYYEPHKRGTLFYWLIMLKTEGGAIEVKRYKDEEKALAIEEVSKLNGWSK